MRRRSFSVISSNSCSRRLRSAMAACSLALAVLQFSGALLHAHLQLVMRAAQRLLGAAALDELTDFAADGRSSC